MVALSETEQRDLRRLLPLKARKLLSPDELHLLSNLLQKQAKPPKLSEIDEVFLQSFTHSSDLLQEMIQHADDTPCNIYTLLTLCGSAPKSELLNTWILQLEKAFEFEPSPLRVLLRIPPYQTPLQFAGVLLYLLRRHITVQEIITSGFLHDFFAHFINEIDKINEAYGLLRAIGPEVPCYKDLQVLLKEISNLRGFIKAEGSERSILNHFALDGTQQNKALETVVVKLPLLRSSLRPYENLHNLYALFGLDFVFYILKEGDLRSSQPPLETFLHDIFDKSDTAGLLKLYQKILAQSLSNPERLRILKSLAITLSVEMVYRLFTDYPQLRWTLIASKLSLLDKLSSKERTQLINQPLMALDLTYFPKCFEDNDWIGAHAPEIFHHIFNLFISNSDLMEIKATVESRVALYSYTKVSEWVKLEAQSPGDNLRHHIILNFPITSDTYQNIRDIYHANQPRFKVLCAFRKEEANRAYPSDIYQLQKLILSLGEERTESPFDLEKYLQVFNSPYEYNAEERIQATMRTLFPCMKDKTLLRLHPFILNYLMSKFSEFQAFIWQLLVHRCGGNTDELLQRLLTSPLQRNSLQYFYEAICKKDDWLEAFIESMKSDLQIRFWQTILRSALDNGFELNPLINFCLSTSWRLLSDILVPKNSISRDSLAYELVTAGQFKPLASFYTSINRLLEFLELTDVRGVSILDNAMKHNFHTWTGPIESTFSLNLSDVFHRSVSKPKEYQALLKAIPPTIHELWFNQGLFELPCSDLREILINLPKTITTIGVFGRVANNRNEIQKVVSQLCSINFDNCIRTIGTLNVGISSRLNDALRDLKANLLIDFAGTKNDCSDRCKALIQHADEATGNNFDFKKITARLVEVLETFANPSRKRARDCFFSEEPKPKAYCQDSLASIPST